MSIEEIIKSLDNHACLFDNMRRHQAPSDGVFFSDVLREAITLLRTHPAVQDDLGKVSDGSHTFNELYHHRAVLFSVICNEHPDLAWKSKLHEDGTMYDGMFIVGIKTPDGQATYHYDIDPYWDMFDVKEMDHAPQWDGHTPAQAIERIGHLSYRRPPKEEAP